jgi:very-short-patch-repair endonuclease
MNEPCVYDGDRLLASAARFLIDGQEEDAANVLLSCALDVWESGETWYQGDERLCAVHIELSGPRTAYDILNNWDHPITKAVRRALDAVLPTHTYIKHFAVAAELMNLDPRWREELLEIARGKGAHNQVAEANAPRTWNNLRFRSESEVRVARALDQANVMFLPNCRARIGLQANRQNREADFLVCHNGKLGILEVDGEPFHPPSRTAEDHERDRLFKLHGILVVEHFDAGECFENPAGVVARFLNILKKA